MEWHCKNCGTDLTLTGKGFMECQGCGTKHLLGRDGRVWILDKGKADAKEQKNKRT